MNNKKNIIVILCVVVMATIISFFYITNNKQEQRKQQITESFQESVDNGYIGNIQEWLESNSIIDNYKQAVEKGYKDSVYEWVKEITGNDIYDIALNNNYHLKEVKWSLEQEDNNANIVDATFNSNNEIVITLENGKEMNIGNVVVKNEEHEIIPDENKPIIYVESINVNLKDNSLVVPVAIKNNPGILGMTLTIEYDDKVFSLVNAKNGEVFEQVSNMTPSKTLISGCKFVWDGIDVTSRDIKDGEILLLEFNIADSSEEGVYSMKVSYEDGDIVDNDLNSIEVLVENGNVIINK